MKKMDKLKITINKKMFIFLLALFVIGIIVGSLFVTILKDSDKTLITESLNNFFSNVKTLNLKWKSTLITTLLTQISYVIGIWILGISIIGLPLILIIYFSKAFILGFSIGSILLNYNVKGILLSIAYIFPHQVINFFIYTILSIYALSLSIKLFDSLLHKKKLDFRPILNKYLFILLLSIVLCITSTLLEVFVMPRLVYYVTTLVF